MNRKINTRKHPVSHTPLSQTVFCLSQEKLYFDPTQSFCAKVSKKCLKAIRTKNVNFNSLKKKGWKNVRNITREKEFYSYSKVFGMMMRKWSVWIIFIK